MNILLTGATGYIGQRLLPILLEQGHNVWCVVRDKSRFVPKEHGRAGLHVLEFDFLYPNDSVFDGLKFDTAYYLIHSMTSVIGGFQELEERSANKFVTLVRKCDVRHIIYLSGVVNEKNLSDHLTSRLRVGEILRSSSIKVTEFRAGIIIGSGGSSFEIIRDLVEKLPIMVVPKWVSTKTQPIGIRDVVSVLTGILNKEALQGMIYDIGGPDILTYGDMLLQYAQVRGLKRLIIHVPVMTPRLSSYWLFFVTSVSYNLAVNLVDSMKVEVKCRPNSLMKELGIKPLSYKETVRAAFVKIEQNLVISSWKDSFSSSALSYLVNQYIEVPKDGVLVDCQKIKCDDEYEVWDRIHRLGGNRGWYYANWLWRIRGVMDKIIGGVGLRRGRRDNYNIKRGDALDFWRVLLIDEEKKRLLLFAEMKTPGEAWLEFRICNGILIQKATFRPRGIMGRLYWYFLVPIHLFIFKGMAKKIAGR